MKIAIKHYEAWGHPGVMVGLEDEGVMGWGDLRPWPSFGTPSLEECLKDLLGARQLPLVQSALYFAALDQKAKISGTSLFKGLSLPESHLYVTDWAACVSASQSYKIKALPDCLGDCLSEGLANLPKGVRVRLDWNARPSFKEALQTLEGLGSLRSRIEWIEDPCPYQFEDWAHLAQLVTLVKDREPFDLRDTFICYKPGMDGWPEANPQLFKDRSVLVSQVLGSPLDAYQTAWVAGQLKSRGLQVFGAFLSERQPGLHLSSAPGWGFAPQAWTWLHA